MPSSKAFLYLVLQSEGMIRPAEILSLQDRHSSSRRANTGPNHIVVKHDSYKVGKSNPGLPAKLLFCFAYVGLKAVDLRRTEVLWINLNQRPALFQPRTVLAFHISNDCFLLDSFAAPLDFQPHVGE
ncbi:MAG: hypothetical protein HW389_3566 [Bacteroidetes bacterium]|nr:hypothetical protein [Bacteroidota bacterium]